MNAPTDRCRFFVLSLALIVGVATAVWAQTGNQNSQGPTGGKTSDSAAEKEKKVTTPKPVRTTTPKPVRNTAPATPAKTTGKSAAPAVAGIDGKWWTTGNDFGTSEVFFKQNGTLVSGAIMYADGRTGTFSGVISGKRITYTWTNSSGERGTGWLEQSWNNFLGGPYRRPNGSSGSGTLARIAGNWCLGGSRERIRKVNHSSSGQLFFVTEDGGQETGQLEGPWIFLHGDFGDVKGSMNYKSNRVEFETGASWTWCGR